MLDSCLSARAKDVLRTSGWTEHRQIDTCDLKRFLESRGVTVSAAAEDFLREFHGLRLIPPDGGLSFVHFDVHEQLGFMEKGELQAFETLVKESLCPIGVGGRFLLFIAPSSKVFFLHDEWLLYLHVQSAAYALEVICWRDAKNYETIWLSDDQKFAPPREPG